MSVPLGWESWRLGRDAWSQAHPVPVPPTADETRAQELEKSVRSVLNDLGSLPSGSVDPQTLKQVTDAHQTQLEALAESRGADARSLGAGSPSPGSPATTRAHVRAGQRALASAAEDAALHADASGYATLFAAVAAGSRELMGVLT